MKESLYLMEQQKIHVLSEMVRTGALQGEDVGRFLPARIVQKVQNACNSLRKKGAQRMGENKRTAEEAGLPDPSPVSKVNK